MQNGLKSIPAFTLGILCSIKLTAQLPVATGCSKVIITELSEIPATCQAIPMTMLHDQQDKPYLYVANKEAGLKIYYITDTKKPKLVATVSAQLFGSLHVMNLAQQGDHVYLALGNHFNNRQAPGMAVVDVSQPDQPVFKSYWSLNGESGGSGIVQVQGDYAFLGAMGNGLIILDISDKTKLKFTSQFIPDINYPDPKPKKSLYNARGMQVVNDLLYLCYDAGGLRIINIKDKANPSEVGRYSNPVMNGKPRAYNNIIIDDSLAYIAVDYCGMEVLNIKELSKIKTTGWWNPFGCPKNNWFSSPVHANEIVFDKKNRLLFLSTGKSDLSVLGVTDPSQPVLCAEFGGVNNKRGTWGVSRYNNEIYLSYICSVIPFSSNKPGVKILSYETGK